MKADELENSLYNTKTKIVEFAKMRALFL